MEGLGMKTRIMTIALLLVPALLQAAAASDDERGWSFSQRFQGTSNSAGVVLKTNTTAGYAFNPHVKAYLGLPVYFVREAAASSSTGSNPFVNGVGNAFTGLTVSGTKESIDYSSDLLLTAPTGDRSRGFSTGHVTVDWTNTFSHPFTSVTPYASIGAANTISDTSFFVRPFTSKGIVAHFEGGAILSVAPRLSFGMSGYGVRAAGEQQIVSKVKSNNGSSSSNNPTSSTTQNTISNITNAVGLGNSGQGKGVFETQYETISSAEIANDHGLSTWLTVRPSSTTDLQIGYSRSMTYQLNSLFFGMGFRVGH
jgi:hypothetical protein